MLARTVDLGAGDRSAPALDPFGAPAGSSVAELDAAAHPSRAREYARELVNAARQLGEARQRRGAESSYLGAGDPPSLGTSTRSVRGATIASRHCEPLPILTPKNFLGRLYYGRGLSPA